MRRDLTAPLFADGELPVCERRAQRVPLRQAEGRSAQYWSEQLLLTQDADRKAYCHAMMIVSLVGLDHSGRGH
jgi:hypothetical protein